MTGNAYTPPKANLDATRPETPALWNPNAAACWCLVIVMVFGMYLHLKNWEALGEADAARKARYWIAGYFGFAVISFALAFTPVGPGPILAVYVGLLLAWYFVAARSQVSYVREHYGEAYPRKPWVKALLLGVLFSAGIAVLGELVDWVANPQGTWTTLKGPVSIRK